MAPSKGKKTPKKGSAIPPDPYADFKKNEQGKYITWRSGTPAADMLKVLVHGGAIDGMTAGQIQKHPNYTLFNAWDNNCFSSALSNLRNGMKKEIATARGVGSTAVKTHTTLASIAEDQSYKSSEDSTFEDLSDAVSQISLDNYSFDTRTVAYRSTAPTGLGRTRSATAKQVSIEQPDGSSSSKKPFYHGSKTVELPWVADQWRDSAGNPRISIQLQLLAGGDMWKKIVLRVATSQRELVVYVPISEFLLRADWALEHFFLSPTQVGPLSEQEKNAYKIIMQVHTKTAGRKVAVSKILERTTVEGKYYVQRIPLSRPVQHDFASKADDQFFWGKKTVTYPDGSSFMFVELVGVKTDSYRAAEDSSVAENHNVASYPFPSAAGVFQAAAAQPDYMETEVATPPMMSQPPKPSPGAVVLEEAYNSPQRTHRPVKRKPTGDNHYQSDNEDKEQTPPIRNLTVPSPSRPAVASGVKTNGDSTNDDEWTYQTVQSNVTGSFPPVPDQEEQQETIVVSALQLAAQAGEQADTNNVTGV